MQSIVEVSIENTKTQHVKKIFVLDIPFQEIKGSCYVVLMCIAHLRLFRESRLISLCLIFRNEA